MGSPAEYSEKKKQDVLLLLRDPSLAPDEVIRLASTNLHLLRDPEIQDLLYAHPATDFFTAVELTVHISTMYFQDNTGPGDLQRMRETAREELRSGITLSWNYPWQHRWALCALRAAQTALSSPAADVFLTLVKDAAAQGALPVGKESLAAWASETASISASLTTASRVSADT